MKIYSIKDFGNRPALEKQVISDFGKTTERKDAMITGTKKQLLELSLEHSNSIWGVTVEEKNYKVNNTPKVKRGIRGKNVPSKLNGQKI